LLSAAKSTARQLTHITTHKLIKPLQTDPNAGMHEVTFTFFPNDAPAYFASRQQNKQLPLDQLNTLHSWVTFVDLPFLFLFMFFAFRYGDKHMSALFVFVLLGLVSNAAICSTLPGVVPRY
jgi:hypothetical protein